MNPLPDSTTPERLSLLLASQSPRRRRVLGWLDVPFSTTAVDTPEELDSPLAACPPALAMSLAAEKALAVRAEGLGDGALTLCFDTIVVLDGDVLGKPRDVADAWRMLRALSGRTHEVVTAVALFGPADHEPRTLSVTTQVQMKTLDDDAIESWMSSGEFMGCAGAYNIEGQVAEVTQDECFLNVTGLPLCHVHAALAGPEFAERIVGIDSLSAPVGACDAAHCRACLLGPRVIAGD